jgi:hypothetical protein
MPDEMLVEHYENAKKSIDNAKEDDNQAIKYAIQLIILIVGEILKRVLK